MAASMTMERTGAMAAPVASAVSYHQMPLSFLKAGEAARVASVKGRGELHHHLENLGFVEGTPVSVVCDNDGNLIVEVRGAQVALDRSVAQRIIMV